MSNLLFTNLEGDILIHIFLEYLTLRESLEAAVTCKQLLQCIETASTVALTHLDQNNNRVDQDFWFRVWQHVHSHNNNNNNNHHHHDQHHLPMTLSMLLTGPHPSPARIVLHAARTTPTAQFTYLNAEMPSRFTGPRVLLPDGKMLVYVCYQDKKVHIFNTNTNEFTLCEERSTLNLEELFFDSGNALLYGSGYLVMGARSTEGYRAAVWELVYDNSTPQQRIVATHFRHEIHLGLPLPPGRETVLALTENGKMYFLHDVIRYRGEALSQEIGVYDVSTGQRIQTFPCNGIPTCDSMLLSSSSAHLLLFRTGHEDDDGIYALDMENGLSLTSFLSGFGERGIHVPIIEAYHTRCIDENGCILYVDKNDNSIRVVSIDASGILRRQETTVGGIRLEAGQEVKHVNVSANRAYICKHNFEGEIKIYEYDFMTGSRVRTMCTGIRTTSGWRDPCVDRIFSNDDAVFCHTENINNGPFLQIFLR